MALFKKKTGGSTKLRNNKLIFALIALLMVIAFVGTLTLIRSVYQTTTYYVLNQDVQTRQQVTPEMLSPVTTSAGTEPKGYTIVDVQSGQIYTKVPLTAGEMLTQSTAGAREDISTGVPDENVITSFSVDADNAVGGRIRRGVYFDVMVVGKDGSYYPFVNMLALDTSVSLSGASSANAADTAEAKAGQTEQYVVGLSPQNAAKLQSIATGGNLKLVLSPRQNEYNSPRLSDYTGKFAYENDVVNAGEGTDYTFTPLKRDAFGRPLQQVATCGKGNAKIDAEVCKEAGSAAPTAAPKTSTPTTTTTPGK